MLELDNLEVAKTSILGDIAKTLRDPDNPVIERLNTRPKDIADALSQVMRHMIGMSFAQFSERQGALENNVVDMGRRLLKLENKVEGRAFIPPQDPDKADQFIKCVRVINQAEDLITDHKFHVDTNNKELEKRLAQKATEEALGFLDDKTKKQFRAIYDEFDSGIAHAELKHARMERVAAIQQLRQDLAVFFSQ